MMKLEGMDTLLQQLKGMEKINRVKEKAVEVGAEHMRQKIEQNTPKSSLDKKHAKDHIIKEKIEDEYLIGPHKDHFYMSFVEFGTSKMSPKPFMEPTFSNEIDETTEIMAKELKKQMGI